MDTSWEMSSISETFQQILNINTTVPCSRTWNEMLDRTLVHRPGALSSTSRLSSELIKASPLAFRGLIEFQGREIHLIY